MTTNYEVTGLIPTIFNLGISLRGLGLGTGFNPSRDSNYVVTSLRTSGSD